MLSKLAFMQSLGRKRGAAGALLYHGARVLIVKPTYKDTWNLPGGVIDALESPLAACLRECQEELGIAVQIDRLLIVDWVAEPFPGAHDALKFIFGGPELDALTLQRIVLPAQELSEWRLVDPEQAATLMVDSDGRRFRQALAANGGAVYAEGGQLVC